MDRPEGLSDHMWKVCLGTWNFDPAKRPPFYKLRKQLEEIVEAGLGKSNGWQLVKNHHARLMNRKDSSISMLGYSGPIISGFIPSETKTIGIISECPAENA